MLGLLAQLVSQAPAIINRMKVVEFWFWMMVSDASGRRGRSPCRLTEADALRRDPGALRVPGSCELRTLPEHPDDVRPWATSAFGSATRR